MDSQKFPHELAIELAKEKHNALTVLPKFDLQRLLIGTKDFMVLSKMNSNNKMLYLPLEKLYEFDYIIITHLNSVVNGEKVRNNNKLIDGEYHFEIKIFDIPLMVNYLVHKGDATYSNVELIIKPLL
ncbi:hypothetical protein [Sphingobacterium mizutaii]|uniref:hypothetical protein n=1 Tax=Sphingobacterium mizutaii TaxID=1010 RepID=UPI002896D11F|nr:hypothetical protein [Sphingobacterium mizutaii]